MPRPSRLVLPSVPLHVVQRGHNRQRCFHTADDFEAYRLWLHEAALDSACALHAYVLMSNHIHLLLSVESTEHLAGMMKRVAQKYAQYFNYRHHRSGTLWDGRYKSCFVPTEDYVLTCQRYIEMNPVRAGIVRFPGNYKWSSYRSNGEGRHDQLLTPHSVYLRLGLNDSDRRQAYLRLFREALTPQQLAEIRAALNATPQP